MHASVAVPLQSERARLSTAVIGEWVCFSGSCSHCCWSRYGQLPALLRRSTRPLAWTRGLIHSAGGSCAAFVVAANNDALVQPAATDWLQYIASYPDLIDAFGADSAAGEQHYQLYGRTEGRALDLFNKRQYLANYADLRAAFGTDLQAATIHYITYGYYEGRTDRASGPVTRPNFVVFFVDDLGYGEVGAVHQPDTATPNIDAIAAAGVIATNGYVTAPLCAPSRAGLLTGRYQQTFGIYGNPPPADSPQRFNGGLPATAGTIAESLRGLGYATGMVGKWNVGYRPDQHPMMRGFDEFFGVLGSAHPYYGETPDNPVLRGFVPEPQQDYLTDVFTREAVGLHPPPCRTAIPALSALYRGPLSIAGNPGKLAQFAGIANDKRRLIAAMLSSLDDGVGAITQVLRELGLADNTVVAFLSDNGCGNCRNGPLRRGKGTFYEGGIRVPFIVSWPGVVPAGGQSDIPVSALDLAPTFLEAAGGSGAGLDGVNILNALRGTSAPHDCLFWGAQTRGAARCGDWKLVVGGGSTELYNMRTDPGETRNVAGANGTVVARLAGHGPTGSGPSPAALGRVRPRPPVERAARPTCQADRGRAGGMHRRIAVA